MELSSEQSPDLMRTTPPPRTMWILLTAVAQGLACWFLPNDWLFVLFPPILVVPVAFYFSERYLDRRPWLPSLLMSLFYLPELCYLYFVIGIEDYDRPGSRTNSLVYMAFCFFSLPFVQTYAELGLRGLRAAELSARMNRNITLGLLGCLALIPVCLVLGLGLGNIDWDIGWGDKQHNFAPLFIFSLAVPMTFALAVNWAQISMEKQAGTGQEWPVLPFLRKTIGVISGWVALVAGLAMACIMFSALISWEVPATPGVSNFFRLLPAAFFWAGCSMSVREGRWEDNSRVFRNTLTACTLVFPLYVLWCVFVQWNWPITGMTWRAYQQHFWSWQNLSLGILLIASLGHGMAVCRRHWPEWASAVNAGVHLCILLCLLASRLPFADPLRYTADASAEWMLANPQESSWYFSRMEDEFGPYWSEAMDRALAKQGKSRNDETWESVLAHSKEKVQEKRRAEIYATFAAMPRLPKDAEIPEGFVDWLAAYDGRDYDSWVRPRRGQYFLLQDLNRDGEPEIILLNVHPHAGEVLERDGEQGWKQAASLYFDDAVGEPRSIAAERPQWDDLIINGKRVTLVE